MIEDTLKWIERINRQFDIRPKRILEIGSMDTNGSPRQYFPESEYIGIDIKPGKGVDMVIPAQDIGIHFFMDHFDAVLCLYVLEHVDYCWIILDKIFDAVLCLYVLEHVDYCWIILDKIDKVLSKHGYLYIAVPGIGFPVHSRPKDYWRFTEYAIRDVIMKDYKIISLEHGKSKFGKYPIINCLGVKK